MRKYQGEDILFSLKMNNTTNPTITNFDNVSNVIVYAYTKEDYVQKFSMVELDGYTTLESISSTELSGIINSEYTKNMLGQLVLEVMIEVPIDGGDLVENVISKTFSKIFIVESTIKASV